MMRINITLPKHFGYINLIYKTFRFFHTSWPSGIYIDRIHRFYIFLERRRIIIRVEVENATVKEELTLYLESVFKKNYIGIPKQLQNYFTLQGVDTYFI